MIYFIWTFSCIQLSHKKDKENTMNTFVRVKSNIPITSLAAIHMHQLFLQPIVKLVEFLEALLGCHPQDSILFFRTVEKPFVCIAVRYGQYSTHHSMKFPRVHFTTFILELANCSPNSIHFSFLTKQLEMSACLYMANYLTTTAVDEQTIQVSVYLSWTFLQIFTY